MNVNKLKTEAIADHTDLDFALMKLAEECSEFSSEVITMVTKTKDKVDRQAINEELADVVFWVNVIVNITDEEKLDFIDLDFIRKRINKKLDKKAGEIGVYPFSLKN